MGEGVSFCGSYQSDDFEDRAQREILYRTTNYYSSDWWIGKDSKGVNGCERNREPVNVCECVLLH